MNGQVRFTFTMLLVVILAGCAAPTRILPTPTVTLPLPTAILPSPTATLPSPTAIPPSPTSDQLPTQPPFDNVLVYDTPEMYKVIVETVQYPTLSGTSKTLLMDVFYPSDRQPTELLPAVILVNGFPDTQLGSRPYGSFPSWGRLIASSGLIAVAYDTKNNDDLAAVIGFMQREGADLGINGSKLGFWSMSSHGGLASSFAFQDDRKYIKFAVFYYAWIMTPDNFMRHEENVACIKYGCLGAQLPDVKRLRNDLPVLVVRCGSESPDDLAQVDHFTRLAKQAGVPLTLINFEEGTHLFDWSINSLGYVKDKAIKIIQQTLEFMKTHV